MRVLDLFSGAAGAWTLGLHWAGFHTVAACEFDPERRAAYATNWPEVRLYDDVRTLTGRTVRRDVGPVDLICGSPPCQDASSANHAGRGIDGERTGLFREAVRLVRELRPRWACFENVPGLGRRGLDRVQRWLDEAGYSQWTIDMGAEDLGAPCPRRRLWIVARAKEEPLGAAGQSWPADAPGNVEVSPRQSIRRRSYFDATDAFAHLQSQPVGAVDDCALAGGGGPSGPDPRAWGDEWLESAARHLRVAAGLPGGVARKVAEAYGDATPPHHAWLIGRAILAAEGRA